MMDCIYSCMFHIARKAGEIKIKKSGSFVLEYNLDIFNDSIPKNLIIKFSTH